MTTTVYDVHTIPSADHLSLCPPFAVDRFNWGGSYRPITSGRLGFLPDIGFLLEMTCQETNPCCVYRNDNDPVCLDSAMEAFFCFTPDEKDPYYLNFEMNANGAMLACYGKSRQNRAAFPEQFRHGLHCQAQVLADCWRIRLSLPLSLIRFLHPHIVLESGSRFTCNFYKIKESKGLTHFASFAPIPVPQPDFHRPEYFASARIL